MLLLVKLMMINKVDYFAQLTRCYLLTEMDNALYYKLAKFLILCTPEGLDYIASSGKLKSDYGKNAVILRQINTRRNRS